MQYQRHCAFRTGKFSQLAPLSVELEPRPSQLYQPQPDQNKESKNRDGRCTWQYQDLPRCDFHDPTVSNMSLEKSETTPSTQSADDSYIDINYTAILPHLIALQYSSLALFCARGISRYHLLVSFFAILCFGYHVAQVHAILVLYRHYGSPLKRADPRTARIVNPCQIEAERWV